MERKAGSTIYHLQENKSVFVNVASYFKCLYFSKKLSNRQVYVQIRNPNLVR